MGFPPALFDAIVWAMTAFYPAFVYLLAAVVTVPLAKRLGLGSVLGYCWRGSPSARMSSGCWARQATVSCRLRSSAS